MKKLTLEQAIIISGYTHVMAVPSFDYLKNDLEKRLGRPLEDRETMTAEFGELMKQVYYEDFMKIAFDSPRFSEEREEIQRVSTDADTTQAPQTNNSDVEDINFSVNA